VYFTDDVLDPANPTLAEVISRAERTRRHRVFVVLDSGVAAATPTFGAAMCRYADAHGKVIDLTAPPENVTGGESCKNDPELLYHLRGRLHELGIDRHSFVAIVGGGAVQDMAGFAAATTHRGVRVIRLPTTVLSQNDGGTGVKNGFNAFGTKNFVGAFAPPFAVINDRRFIDTLEHRDRVAGMAEAVKVALIRDAAFFDWLIDHAEQLARFQETAMTYMIRRSAELHLRHIAVSGDPFEWGTARPLDFGHWAAHKLETLSGYSLRHGEAVAIGIALDSRYSVEAGLLGEQQLEVICGLLERLGLHLWHESMDLTDATGRPQVLRGLAEFREHLGGALTIPLLTDIGCSIDSEEVDTDRLLQAIDWLRARDKTR
jgi:3-dehydroquinate synthase